MSQRDLIESLCVELRPVQVWKPSWRAFIWPILIAGMVVAGDVIGHGGATSNWWPSVWSYTEVLAQVFVLLLGSWLIVNLSVPARPTRSLLRGFYFACSVWLGSLVLRFVAEKSEISALVYLNHCFLEVLAIAALPLLATFFAVKKGAPLNRWLLGAVVGATTGTLGSIVVRFVCPWGDPGHVMVMHHVPILVLSVASGFVAASRLRWDRL